VRIAGAARTIGISASWMRRLELAGRIPPASRDINGHRRYSADDIAAIRRSLLRRVSSPSFQPATTDHIDEELRRLLRDGMGGPEDHRGGETR